VSCAILLLTFGTLFIVRFQIGSLFEDSGRQFELSDQFVVIFWVLVAFALCVFASQISAARHLGGELTQKRRFFTTIIGVGAVILLSSSFLLDLDPQETGNWSPFSLEETALGAVIALALWRLALVSRDLTYHTQLLIIAPSVAYFIPALVQSPSTIRDSLHFNFFYNELSAAAAGVLPLEGFATQYSALLGVPLIPLLRIFPSYSEAISLTYLLCLQVVCLILPVLTVVRIVGAHIVPISWLVVSGVSIAGITGSFTNMPARVIFPLLLLALLIKYKDAPAEKQIVHRPHLILGLISGAAVINSPEFGLPVVIALLVTTAIGCRTFNDFFKALSLLLTGQIVFLTANLLLVVLSGGRPQLNHLLLFAQTFRGSDTWPVPMAVGGFHVAAVITFAIGIAIGTSVGRGLFELSSVMSAKLSALLIFTSTWGLLTMPYFAGRSFTSVAIAGSGLQFALVVVGLVAVTLEVLKNQPHQRAARSLHLTSIGVTVAILFVSATAFLTRIPSPQSQAAQLKLGLRYDVIEKLVADVSEIESVLVDRDTVQIFPLSNIVELKTGIQSVLTSSHPIYMLEYSSFMQFQCEQLRTELDEAGSTGDRLLLLADGQYDYGSALVRGCSQDLEVTQVLNPNRSSSIQLFEISRRT
jgi:hypothetical protein